MKNNDYVREQNRVLKEISTYARTMKTCFWVTLAGLICAGLWATEFTFGPAQWLIQGLAALGGTIGLFMTLYSLLSSGEEIPVEHLRVNVPKLDMPFVVNRMRIKRVFFWWKVVIWDLKNHTPLRQQVIGRVATCETCMTATHMAKSMQLQTNSMPSHKAIVLVTEDLSTPQFTELKRITEILNQF